MAWFAAAIPYISAGVSALGAVKTSQAQSMASDYNAQIARKNAQIADAQGAAAADAQSRDSQRKIGAAMASYGASGVVLSEGSPADVLAESARMSELDALTLKYNYKLKALGFGDQARLESMNAGNATTAGYFNAASAVGGAYAKFG